MIALIRSLTLPTRIADRARSALGNAAARRGIISVADQMVVSGTNFLTTIIVGRACLPEELGLYSIGFSLTVVLMGLPRALVWTPYTTFTPSLSNDDRRFYAGSALAHQVMLCAIMAALVSGLAIAAPLIGIQGVGQLLLVLGPALAVMCLREHVRRIYFSHLQTMQALVVDAAVATLQLGGMAALAAAGSLTAVRAYLVIIAAYLPVLTVWYVCSRQTMTIQRQRVVGDLSKNWKYGRWIFASALAYGVDDALYPWALSWMHGTTAVGILSAASGVIFLMNPLVLAFWSFFGPQSAHVYTAAGINALYRLVIKSGAALGLLIAAFTVIVAIWGGDLAVLLFGDDYRGQGNVVTAAAIGQLGFVVTIPITLGLMAVGRGDLLLRTVLLRLAVSATFGLWCIDHWGAVGVGIGQCVSNLASGIWQLLALRMLVRRAEEVTT